MKRIVLFYLLVLSCCSLAIAQNITVQGKVIDENHEAIPFANIVLVSAQDTTNILQGTSTNLNGVFTLKSLDKAAYVLRISFLGYKTNIFPLNLQATKKKLVSQTIVLLPDVVALNEVVVAGKRSIQSIDKTAYTFSMEQMAKAGESRALVATLPNLHVDKASNGLKSINGKSVMILINGVKATDADLRLIPADKIKKVDYYDVPPIRYMNDAEIVINVHTKPLDTGWNGSFYGSVGQMYSGQSSALSFIKGNNKLTVGYSNHFNMKRSVLNLETGHYDYQVDGNQYQHDYIKKNKFWGYQHIADVTYSNSVEDNYNFQVKGSYEWYKENDEANKDITLTNHQLVEKGKGLLTDDIYTKSGVLDIYYSKKLNKDDELTFDLLGTYYGNDQETYSLQTGSHGFEDDLFLDNTKKSLIGEVVYEHKLGHAYLTGGYRGHFNFLANEVKNSLVANEMTEDINTQKHYFYGEISGRTHAFMYRASLAGTYDVNLGDEGFKHLTFTPMFMAGYSINPSQSVRLSYQSSTQMPGVQQMSSTRLLIMNDFYQSGNPSLENEHTQLWGVSHDYRGELVSLKTYLYYQHKSNSLYSAYSNTADGVLLQSANAAKDEELGASLDLDLTPWDFLRIGGSVGATQYGFQPTEELATYHYWSYPVSIYLSANYKDWSFEYYQKFGGTLLSGLYRTGIEKVSYVSLDYKYRRVNFGLICYFPFTKDKVNYETISSSVVSHQKFLHMRRKDHTFGVSVSWYFNSGKRKASVEQNTYNSDSDKGVFKVE